ELERRDGEERLPRKTGRDRLGRFDKPLRVRVGREERSERLGSARREGCDRADKLEELLAGADREPVGGVCDDVGMVVLVQVEADGQPPGTGPSWIVVGDGRHARRIRVSHRHGRSRPARVRGARQFRSLSRRPEHARTHQPFGMGGSKARMHPELIVYGIEQLLGEGWVCNCSGPNCHVICPFIFFVGCYFGVALCERPRSRAMWILPIGETCTSRLWSSRQRSRPLGTFSASSSGFILPTYPLASAWKLNNGRRMFSY